MVFDGMLSKLRFKTWGILGFRYSYDCKRKAIKFLSQTQVSTSSGNKKHLEQNLLRFSNASKNVVCLLRTNLKAETNIFTASKLCRSSYVNILIVIKNMPHLSNKAHVEEVKLRLHKNTSYKTDSFVA